MGKPALRETVPRAVLRDTGADSVRAILLANLCFLLLTVGDIAAVLAMPVIGVAGAMLGRGGVGAALLGGLLLGQHGPGAWRRLVPARPWAVLLRSVLHAGSSVTWYVAWQLGMPLAESYAVAYAAPLMMALLAAPILGERLGGRRLAATLVGFLGMLVMLRPGGALWTPVALLLLPGVLGIAISRTMARVLATTETAECLTFWLLALHVAIGGALLLAGYPAPDLDWHAAGGVLVLGLTTALGHWLLSRAAALAPIAALAPYEYTVMLWGIALGYWAFGQVPSWSTLAGAAVVAGAGIDNLLREQRRSRAERAPAPGAPLSAPGVAVAQRNDA